jgi:hypothetical protein
MCGDLVGRILGPHAIAFRYTLCRLFASFFYFTLWFGELVLARPNGNKSNMRELDIAQVHDLHFGKCALHAH